MDGSGGSALARRLRKSDGNCTLMEAGIPRTIQLWTRCAPPFSNPSLAASFAGPPRWWISSLSFISSLHNMFNQMSNMMCINDPFSSASCGGMTETPEKRHPSLERLLDVAREIDPMATKSSLAALLRQSEQTITNWGARGVSEKGARLAQKVLGVSVAWLMDGVEPRMVAKLEPGQPDLFVGSGVTRKEPQHAEADDSASSLLLRLAGLLEALTPSARKAAASLVSDAVIDPGLAPGNATALHGLVAAASEPDALRPLPAAKTPMERLLAQKQTPSATPKTPARPRRSTGT